MRGDRFCSTCDVVRELHPDPDNLDPEPADCEIAGAKADMLASFDRMIVRVVGR